ncbi:MAG: rhomboid family intramembrane serine protease [Marinilabiliales bacterium]|nr:MAG: rhomboid family intramembrane serine protease [Marinilabiliales bacterium]
MSIIDEIKYSLRGRNNFNTLIYINLGVFLLITLSKIIVFFGGFSGFDIVPYLAVPADPDTLANRPWTVITYMFTHTSFIHILFNLMVFFWFGRLFLQFLSQRQMLGVYIMGGISGAAFYILAYNLIPAFSFASLFALALGASASVMAIVIAVATLVPNQEVFMLFFGKVKLKYLALVIIAIDLISIPIGNAGGHIAHLGGALLGYLFVRYYRKGTDITIWLSRFLYGIKEFFKPSKEMKVKPNKKKKKASTRPETDMEYNARKKAEQDEIDKILDKVAQSGYSSLSKDEKEKLFKMSNKS